ERGDIQLAQLPRIRRSLRINERDEDLTARVGGNGAKFLFFRCQNPRRPMNSVISPRVAAVASCSVKGFEPLFFVCFGSKPDNLFDLVDFEIDWPRAFRHDMKLGKAIGNQYWIKSLGE